MLEAFLNVETLNLPENLKADSGSILVQTLYSEKRLKEWATSFVNFTKAVLAIPVFTPEKAFFP